MKMLKESMPKNLLLIEKVRKESVPRNQKNSKETGLRLKNAKPRSQMKIHLDSESQKISKLKMIAMMIGFGILTWIRSSMPTRF